MRPIAARVSVLTALVLTATTLGRAQPLLRAAPGPLSNPANTVSGGELRLVGSRGTATLFPLKHTDVHAEISGCVAQVSVEQVFHNPFDHPIEAIYVFPLPRRAAVDAMEIRIGERTIRAVIKKREEARALYNQARRSGQTAALLDQERPNVFTQSVANILPGEEIVVSLRYFDLLPYESGRYEFAFPMTVGPRFIPAGRKEAAQPNAGPADPAVDTANLHPPMSDAGQRSGHDIALTLRIDAGAEIPDLESPSHGIDVEWLSARQAVVRLRQEDSIPNKDFIVRYRIDGSTPTLAVLAHKSGDQGNFLLLVQPEFQAPNTHIAPKEMIFVVDCSGSMLGEPIERVKEAMRYALENLNPLDNFQIIRFDEEAESFAPMPVPATPAMIDAALKYVSQLSGNGGTILLDGVKRALGYPADPQRLRIISFMTDGYIGNEEEILSYMSGHLGGARLFSFGVGSSPNRYLLDKMAEFGRGGAQYLPLSGDVTGPIREFYDRIRSPYLTDLQIDWGGLQVSEIYPRHMPDLFLGQPIVMLGAYDRAGEAEVTLRGRLGPEPYERRVRIVLPEKQDEGEAIGTLWARWKIEDLSDQKVVRRDPGLVRQITDLALAHHLVSAYTSFVAVDEWRRTDPIEPERVENPVPLPQGMAGGVAGSVIGGVVGGVVGSVPVPQDENAEALAERIQVQAQSDIVQTESAEISTRTISEFISGLPVLGTDYQDILTLAPGVTDPTSGAPNVHGARDTDVVTLVDGVVVEEEDSGAGAIEDLDTEAIEEIEVTTAGAGAGLSRAQRGFVNIVPATGPTRNARGDAGAFPVFCMLKASAKSHRVGEPISLYIGIRNLSGKPLKVPSLSEGSLPFRILDPSWTELPSPVPAPASERRRILLPGEWVFFKMALNGQGGYKLDRPGIYQVVFLGSKLGLVDSTQLALRIVP